MPHVWSARSRTDRSPCPWSAGRIGLWFAAWAWGAASPARAGDDVPELLPPIDGNPAATTPLLIDPTRTPIVSTPAPPRPRPDPGQPSSPASPAGTIVPPPAPLGQANAVLALPGLGGPGSPRRDAIQPMSSLAGPSVAPDRAPAALPDPVAEPTLNGPQEMPDIGAIPGRSRAVRQDDGTDAISGRPPTIPDPVIEERTPPAPDRNARSPRERAADRSSGQGTVPAAGPAPRRGRFFGLLPAPLAVAPSTLVGRAAPGAKINARATDEADPKAVAAQAALKARIEKQARAYVGDRARSIEVQLDQRDAVIRARGVSLFQKRAVRRTIESLPALSGLRTTIEVDN